MNEHSKDHRWRRRLTWITTVMAITVMTLSGVAVAAHFNDVPNNHTFHTAITWMKNNGVTVGCNPPANTLYCPEDNVTRGQMAAFMRRNAAASGNVGARAATGTQSIQLPSGTTPLVSLTVPAKHQATVALNASLTLIKSSTDAADVVVFVRRGSCSGTTVGNVRYARPAGATERTPVSVTAVDTMTGPTEYWLCAANATPDSQHAGSIGLTASWSPTG